MTAIGTEALAELLDEAAEVGITANQIADTLRMQVNDLEIMSGRDRSRIEQMISERAAARTVNTGRRAPADAGLATSRQVDYIVDLLVRRVRNGGGGGFMSTRGLVDEAGRPQRAEIAKLDRAAASRLIDSLRDTY